MAAPPRKAQLWQELKNAAEMGVPVVFTKAYVSYTEAELDALVAEYIGNAEEQAAVRDGADAIAAAFDLARDAYGDTPGGTAPAPAGAGASNPLTAGVAGQSGAQAATPVEAPPVSEWGRYAPQTLARLLGVPFSDVPSRRAGLTFNSHGPDDVLRVDSSGKVWYRDEVPKPAIPLPRMRRKVKYVETGSKKVERRLADGHLDESFEVAGDGHEEREIRVTLPSSQVGIYYDARLPFRIHVYNGRRGFDYMDVLRFYKGLDLVPVELTETMIYVGDDLVFDINKTRMVMERELRDAQLRRS
ncbi:hypothetical protein SEA_FEDE_47 [Microbacterium phage Fede]|nr:hypothetical protein SEA_FEDE_47 [Microbacterium phage Fede]